MDFLELTKKRYFVRSYTSQEVEKEKLDYILECARYAPSAVNKQPWQFIVINSELQKKKLQKVYSAKWFAEAPLYIIVCANDSVAWTRQYDNKNHADIDAAITTEHICLAAAEQGLGTCWVCNFDIDECKHSLGLSANIHPVAIIPIGYPADSKHNPTARKSIDEIVTIL